MVSLLSTCFQCEAKTFAVRTKQSPEPGTRPTGSRSRLSEVFIDSRKFSLP